MLTLINHSFFFFTVILLIRSFAAIKQEFVNKIKDVQKKKSTKIYNRNCVYNRCTYSYLGEGRIVELKRIPSKIQTRM